MTKKNGFTLVELVMVIVVLGIMAAYAIPKMAAGSDFDARALHDKSIGMLRFAQKEAVAQRRLVCVSFTANSIAIVASANASASDCSTPSPVATPGGSSVQGKGSAAFTATPGNFNFDALGRPVNTGGAEITTQQVIQVAGVTKSIKIESATGYVHE